MERSEDYLAGLYQRLREDHDYAAAFLTAVVRAESGWDNEVAAVALCDLALALCDRDCFYSPVKEFLGIIVRTEKDTKLKLSIPVLERFAKSFKATCDAYGEEGAYTRAREVFGDEDRAAQWMLENNPALDNRPPIIAIQTESGRREVFNILGRIQSGVIS